MTTMLLPALLFGLGLLIGFGSGAWALAVLIRPGVKAAFAPSSGQMTRGAWALTTVLGVLLAVGLAGVVMYASGGSATRAFAPPRTLDARVQAAASIVMLETRDEALKAVALDAATDGDIEVVKQALQKMHRVTAKDETASQCAVRLAQAGQIQGAGEVAHMIFYLNVRDQTLQRIVQPAVETNSQ